MLNLTSQQLAFTAKILMEIKLTCAAIMKPLGWYRGNLRRTQAAVAVVYSEETLASNQALNRSKMEIEVTKRE